MFRNTFGNGHWALKSAPQKKLHSGNSKNYHVIIIKNIFKFSGDEGWTFRLLLQTRKHLVNITQFLPHRINKGIISIDYRCSKIYNYVKVSKIHFSLSVIVIERESVFCMMQALFFSEQTLYRHNRQVGNLLVAPLFLELQTDWLKDWLKVYFMLALYKIWILFR